MSDGQAAPYGGVDIVEEVSVRLGGVEIGCLARVNHRASTNGKVGVKLTPPRVLYRCLETAAEVINALDTAGLVDCCLH